MMTNNAKLPTPFARAAHDYHESKGSDLGLTQVVAPVRQVALQRRFADQIVEDVSERAWSVLGQATHSVLEKADTDPDVERRRLTRALDALRALDAAEAANDAEYEPADGPFAEAIGELEFRLHELAPREHDVLTFSEHRWERTVRGWKVAGRADHLSLEPELAALTDYKIVSVWAIKEGAKPDWVAQLNLLRIFAPAELQRLVRRLQVVAILRDWRKNERLRYHDYPEYQVVPVAVPLWSDAVAEAYLDSRVALHQEAAREGAILPECTPAERWERPATYAVMKVKRKSAVRVYDTLGEAEQHLDANPDPALSIQVRKGESPRCAQYCSALPFCSQGKRILDELEADAAARKAEAAAA